VIAVEARHLTTNPTLDAIMKNVPFSLKKVVEYIYVHIKLGIYGMGRIYDETTFTLGKKCVSRTGDCKGTI